MARGSHRGEGTPSPSCILNGTGCFLLEHRRGTFRSWTRIAEPHEATTLLLTHWIVGIEEFCCKIGKGLIVKLKLALERSVRDPAALTEEC
jgi:hypothetical protein